MATTAAGRLADAAAERAAESSRLLRVVAVPAAAAATAIAVALWATRRRRRRIAHAGLDGGIEQGGPGPGGAAQTAPATTAWPAWLAWPWSKRKPIRVYCDGCFDLMHYGHANALRQAKACGDVLVVGVVPDAEIARCKGPPVMTEDERLAVVRDVKWVDEVLAGVPYEVTPAFLAELFGKHRIDVIVHGDDPCLLPDGSDAYAAAKAAKKYREVKRTEGVSSTDLLARMLAVTQPSPSAGAPPPGLIPRDPRPVRLLLSSRRLAQFSGSRAPHPGSRVVYVPGVFDMYHAGWVDALARCRALGDFVLVGLHDDDLAAARLGPPHPLLCLHERALSVLASRSVDEVLLGAPWRVSADLLATWSVAVVVHVCGLGEPGVDAGGEDPYAIPRARGMYRELTVGRGLTAQGIIRRVAARRSDYDRRNAAKGPAEARYLATKGYVQEL